MSATILNLYRLLDDLETLFFPLADDQQLKLFFTRGPDVPQYIRADEVKLRLLLTTLLNSLIESSPLGSISLRIDTVTPSPQSSSELHLSFKIEKEDNRPGKTSKSARNLSSSSGVGETDRDEPGISDLAVEISFRDVQRLGGTLIIESTPWNGIVIAFDIPVDLIGPVREDVYPDQKLHSVLGLACGQPQWRVLIADERRAARLLLIHLLTPVGFDVREAGSAQEVIDLWQAWQPHLILMDLGMLVLDGREAVQRIKADTELRPSVIVALTASSFKQPLSTVLQEGCDDFLCKPFEDVDLFEMLRKHLGVQYIYADEPVVIPDSRAVSTDVPLGEILPPISNRDGKGLAGRKGTILIVDDNPAMLESLMTLLKEQGYTVYAFLDGRLALKFVDSTLPDLILLDILMPGMNGYQVCRQLKARDRTRDIPIIFLTVMTETLDKVQGFRMGAVDYIVRPFEAEEVFARVSTHLALRSQHKQLEAKNIQLHESEEIHRLTLSSISDAVFLTDESGAFKFICPNVHNIFGYSVDEVQSLGNISKLLGGDLFVPADLETLGEIQNIERTITAQGGKAHALLVNVKRISIREATQLYTCRDITERKLAEDALRESDLRIRELWKQTQDALTKAEALYRVNRSLIATTDLPGLLQAMVESVAEYLPANRVTLFTVDLKQHLVIHEVRGGPGKKNVVDIDFDEMWEGLIGWVLREGKPALSPNKDPDPRESPRVQRRRAETECGSILIVPLYYQDRILGAMTAINCPDERDFTREDVELMVAFASQAAIAIENARLYQELQSSYEEMEQRVEKRTAELAQANASLKAEIAERRRAEEALQATILEKERLYQSEARRRKEAETLRDVTAVISATTDRSAVLGLILDQLKRVVPYDSASVMLVSGDLLDMAAQRGLQTKKPFPAPIRLGNFPHIGQVLEHRQPVMIADTAADARWQASPNTEQIRCWLGVPLVIQDKVIGLLNVDKAQPGFYTENDSNLAMAFANYASIALENARLFDTVRRRAQDLEALEEISSGLRQAETSEAILQFIVKKSVEALTGDAGALLQVEGGKLILKSEYGRNTGLLGRIHSPVKCMHWQAIQTGEPLYLTGEIMQNESLCQCEICFSLIQDMAACVVIPLKTAKATVGLLQVVFRSRREFSEEKRRMLATIAEITGGALHRAGILETLEQRIADRTRELAALYEVTAVSSEALDLQTMLERSLDRVLKAMRSSIATIHLLDENGKTLSLAAYQTIAPATPAEIGFFMPVGHVKEALIVRGEPLIIPDMTYGWHSSSPPGLLKRACTYGGAPMRARGRRLGILGVARDVGQQFSIEEVALLTSIADQVAVAVENARLHQQSEQMAIVEERARLARELHDSVTQYLSSVTLLAQAASDFTDVGEWGRVKHYLDRIRDAGGQALKEMRLLLYELQPPLLDQESLVEMLTRRLDAVEERAGVMVELRTEDWQRLPVATEEALYRIALEALNNALKHSSATKVTIALRGSPESAILEVNDNGIGFDPKSIIRKGGMGLLSMQQRAEKLGGELTVQSVSGQGTCIKVRVDIQKG